ncbi:MULTISPECIES: hypothetical protein [Pectobacterium]|nr:hypothetical protein [Pectobacterium brasiliense]WJM82003.1 hypothetical protein QTI90_04405 [Pectobacterium brasiliense]
MADKEMPEREKRGEEREWQKKPARMTVPVDELKTANQAFFR